MVVNCKNKCLPTRLQDNHSVLYILTSKCIYNHQHLHDCYQHIHMLVSGVYYQRTLQNNLPHFSFRLGFHREQFSQGCHSELNPLQSLPHSIRFLRKPAATYMAFSRSRCFICSRILEVLVKTYFPSSVNLTPQICVLQDI